MSYIAVIITLAALVAQQPPSPNPVTGEWSTNPNVVESVVYGEVVSVNEVVPWMVRATFSVKSTLTGPYDVTASPTLRANVYVIPRDRNGQSPGYPKAKTRVVARLRAKAAPGPVPWYVPTLSPADGGPGRPAFVEVKDFNDPKVAEIIAELRKGRAAQPDRPWNATREAILAEHANPKGPGAALPLSSLNSFRGRLETRRQAGTTAEG